jgi:hypothetical protein
MCTGYLAGLTHVGWVVRIKITIEVYVHVSPESFFPS